MADIIKEQIELAYRLGVAIYKSEITFRDAKKQLVDQTGMNPNSARDYIKNVGHLLNGTFHNRNYSELSAGILLDAVSRDFGDQELKNAIKSVQSFVTGYLKSKGKKSITLLELASQYEKRLEDKSLSQFVVEFDIETKAARKLDLKELERRANRSSGVPPRVTVITSVFKRNADVRAFVEMRANGICENCKCAAPFVREDEIPYLEVHHRIPLAEGGDDTVANAIALCPNCHREAHFGAEWQKFRIIAT